MAIVGIVTNKEAEALRCFKKLVSKYKSEPGIVKNPFTIKHKFKVTKTDLFFVMEIKPVYPQVYFFGYILLIPFIIFKWFNWFLLFPFALMSLAFLWSSSFYYLMLILSLKKNGYKSKYKILTKEKIIRRLL